MRRGTTNEFNFNTGHNPVDPLPDRFPYSSDDTYRASSRSSIMTSIAEQQL
jgi:hypothetical protein